MSDDLLQKYEKLLAEVKKEFNQIYKFVNTKINEEDPHSIAERLARTTEYLARSGQLKANAKFVYTVARQMAINDQPQAKKELLDGAVAEEQRLFDSTDRLNASITHHIDALRSLLSWHKDNRRNSDNTQSSQNKRAGDQPS